MGFDSRLKLTDRIIENYRTMHGEGDVLISNDKFTEDLNPV
jgi:hypothetical protein